MNGAIEVQMQVCTYIRNRDFIQSKAYVLSIRVLSINANMHRGETMREQGGRYPILPTFGSQMRFSASLSVTAGIFASLKDLGRAFPFSRLHFLVMP